MKVTKAELRQLLNLGFSYVNIRTGTALGGKDGSREETKAIKRIRDLLKQQDTR